MKDPKEVEEKVVSIYDVDCDQEQKAPEETTSAPPSSKSSSRSAVVSSDNDTTNKPPSASLRQTTTAVATLPPRSNKIYGSKDYWEERFETEQDFDWLLSYEQLAPQLEPFFFHDEDKSTTKKKKENLKVLIVGCGNAPFSADLYQSGLTHNIVNTDYSKTVIATMRAKHAASCPKMTWLVVDMLELDDMESAFAAESFDIVIDKAVMDTLLTGEGDVWNPNAEVVQKAHTMCRQISRVLKSNGGIFLQISLAQPHFRRKYLLGLHSHHDNNDNGNGKKQPHNEQVNDDPDCCREYEWSLSFQHAGRDCDAGCFGHYLYIMKKK
jgi:EEF1A lysine methyltransferase 4